MESFSLNETQAIQSKFQRIFDIEYAIEKLKEEQDELKKDVEGILSIDGDYRSFKDDLYEVHHKSGSVSSKLDEKAFEKEEPEEYKKLFEKYCKTTIGKDSWVWTKQKKLQENVKTEV